MRVNQKDGVEWLTFPHLSGCGGILHGFATRKGGVSTGIWSEMNLSFSRGDDPEAVKENYRRISSAIGFSPEQIVSTDQTHTVNVRRVDRTSCGSGVTREREFRDVDGLITNDPEVVLAAYSADCVLLFFYDPVRRCIGLTHSGWRGTVGRIGAVTVHKMQEEFGTDPADLLVGIGPSICRDCYEVGGEVIDAVRKLFPDQIAETLYDRKKNGKFQLDLWETNRQILLACGVLTGKIRTSGICTCCNPDYLFSHRASQGRRGNAGGFLKLC